MFRAVRAVVALCRRLRYQSIGPTTKGLFPNLEAVCRSKIQWRWCLAVRRAWAKPPCGGWWPLVQGSSWQISMLNVAKKLSTELGDSVVFVKANVTSSGDVQAAVDTATNMGSLRAAINCAGIGFGQRTVNRDGSPHSVDAFSKVIEINLLGTFNMLRLSAAAMAKNDPIDGQRGVVINTASVAAFDGQIGQVAYAASKGGIVGMTLPAARDLAKINIRVVTIAPGTFDTPLLGQRCRTKSATHWPLRFQTRAAWAAPTSLRCLRCTDRRERLHQRRSDSHRRFDPNGTKIGGKPYDLAPQQNPRAGIADHRGNDLAKRSEPSGRRNGRFAR